MSIFNRKLRRYTEEKGQALILVLILLAVGSLMIVPALKYTVTGMYSIRVSENKLSSLYTADSAIDDALWQLLNGMMNNLTQTNSSIGYNFTFGTSRVPVVITVPSVPPSQQLATGNIKYLMLQVSPNFLQGRTDNASLSTNYIVRSQTQPWQGVTNFEVTLPSGLTYVANSNYFRGPDPQNELNPDCSVNTTTHKVLNRSGVWVDMSPGSGSNNQVVYSDPPPGGYLPNISYLLITSKPDGRQHLKWRTYFVGTPSGNRTYVMTYQVSGKPPGGINYALFSYLIGSQTATDVPTAALGVAFYTVKITVGAETYQVVVAFDSATGAFKIVSYQKLG